MNSLGNFYDISTNILGIICYCREYFLENPLIDDSLSRPNLIRMKFTSIFDLVSIENKGIRNQASRSHDSRHENESSRS